MPAFDTEFGDALANHAPMVLVALSRLGATSQRISEFFAIYRDANDLRQAPPPTGVPLTEATWKDALGERAREGDLRRFFAAEVARLGIDGALRTYLPPLAPGIGASALHALMRTAYAVLRRDPAETGIALAYWAATYLTMPAATGAAPLTDDPAEVLRRVSQIDALRNEPIRHLLWHNMASVGAVPAFGGVVDWLDVTPATPDRCASAAVALFAATQEFCALHALSGSHWLRLISPFAPQPDLLLRHFWQAIAALMPKMGFPALPDGETLDAWRRLPVPAWPEIAQAAIASNDEHDISLVFSAREEMRHHGDPLYQLVAARRMMLVPAYGDESRR